MVNGALRRVVGHIQTILQTIQAKLQWDKKYECTAVEKLSVEQNLEVILAADEYYRSQYSEPSGSQASWNTRDQHMVTTLMRIKEHLKGPKMVVWARGSISCVFFIYFFIVHREPAREHCGGVLHHHCSLAGRQPATFCSLAVAACDLLSMLTCARR